MNKTRLFFLFFLSIGRRNPTLYSNSKDLSLYSNKGAGRGHEHESVLPPAPIYKLGARM